jgi:putative tricarboxylic transport membrane protein
MKKTIPDIVAFAVWTIFASVFAAGALMLGLGGHSQPGPGFMPFVVGAFMGSLSLLALVQTLKGRSEESSEALFSRDKIRNPIKVYAAILGYAFVMNYLGFLISTTLFMLYLFKFILPQRLSTALIATGITVALSYLIFVQWLGCQFPGIFR